MPAQIPFDLRPLIDGALYLAGPNAYAAGLELACLVYDDVPDALQGDAAALARLLLLAMDHAARRHRHGDMVLRVMLATEGYGGELALRFTLQVQAETAPPSLSSEIGGQGGANDLRASAVFQDLLQRLNGSLEGYRNNDGLWRLEFSLGLDTQPYHGTAQPGSMPLQGRVLLVEHHDVVRMALHHNLAGFGLEVMVAEHRSELPELIASGDAPSLIILGLAPDASILDLVEPGGGRIPCLILAASTDHRTLEALRGHGVAAVLPKSVPRDLLRACIQALLSSSSTPMGKPRPDQAPHIPVYDRERALELAGGNADLAEQLFAMLREELPQRRQALREAEQRHDLEALKEVAHKLRGGASYCAVTALERAAGKLERLLPDGDQDRVQQALERLEAEIRRALEWNSESG